MRAAHILLGGRFICVSRGPSRRVYREPLFRTSLKSLFRCCFPVICHSHFGTSRSPDLTYRDLEFQYCPLLSPSIAYYSCEVFASPRIHGATGIAPHQNRFWHVSFNALINAIQESLHCGGVFTPPAPSVCWMSHQETIYADVIRCMFSGSRWHPSFDVIHLLLWSLAIAMESSNSAQKKSGDEPKTSHGGEPRGLWNLYPYWVGGPLIGFRIVDRT